MPSALGCQAAHRLHPGLLSNNQCLCVELAESACLPQQLRDLVSSFVLLKKSQLLAVSKDKWRFLLLWLLLPSLTVFCIRVLTPVSCLNSSLSNFGDARRQDCLSHKAWCCSSIVPIPLHRKRKKAQTKPTK